MSINTGIVGSGGMVATAAAGDITNPTIGGIVTTGDTTSVDDNTAHKVLVGIVFMIVMLIILTEVAGTSHQWAIIIGLLLTGPLLIEGFSHSSNLTSWLQTNPYNPN